MGPMVDVVVIVAADREDDAVLAVNAGARGTWTLMSKSELPPGYGLKVWRCEFLTAEDRPFTMVLSRAPAQRAEATTKIATELVKYFKPTCLAMCGVCGGRPSWTRLGDVVIASSLYKFGAGRNTSTTLADGNTVRRHTPAIVTYNLDSAWRQAAERFQVAGQWLAARPIEPERQADWFIHELGQGRNPRESPDRRKRCADWSDVLATLRTQGVLDKDSIILTESGRIRARRLDDDNPDGLPEPSQTPIKVIVAPFGTSDNLEARAGIWEDLELHQAGVAALDMEASAIGLVGQECKVPITIVGKGVMDYADEKREYGYRNFAARASAEVIIGLIRGQLDQDEGFTNLAAQRQAASKLSSRARTLLAEIHRLQSSGHEYRVPDDFVRVSKAASPAEAALHEALRELRKARCIDGDGRWRPGNVATLTESGRYIAYHLASLPGPPLVAAPTPAVAPARAVMSIVVDTMTSFSRPALIDRVRWIQASLPLTLHHYPDVLTEGLRWTSSDGKMLEIGLAGRITYTADVSAAASLRKDKLNGEWGTETKPGVSILALLQSPLLLARFAGELCGPDATLTIAVSLVGVEGRTLSFDQMDHALRPNERTWNFRFWNHDVQSCRVPSVHSEPRSLKELTRQDACLAIFEDIAAFFLFHTERSSEHPRSRLRALLDEIDAL